MVAPASAGTSNFGPLYSIVNGPDTQSVVLSVDPTISGSATLELTLYGDLNQSDENLAVTIDGVNIGTVNGLQCSVFNRTVTIPAAILAPLIADGQITLSFTSTVSMNSGCLGNAPPFNSSGELAFAVQGTLTFQPGGQSLNLAVTASPSQFSGAGQSIAYSYAVTNASNVPVTSLGVTDTRVSGISCLATTLAGGASTICTGTTTTTAADVKAGAIVDTATATGASGGSTISSAPVTTRVGLDAAAVRQATLSTIRNFLNNRARTIASLQPSNRRMHRRLTGSLLGSSNGASDPSAPMTLGGPGPSGEDRDMGRADAPRESREEFGRPSRSVAEAGPVSVTGNAEDASGAVSFSASLSGVRQSAGTRRAAQESATETPMGLGMSPRLPSPATYLPSAVDVWIEGTTAYYRDDTLGSRRKGHTSIFYVGADYLVRPSVLLGVLVQFDWTNETAAALGTSASGRGWMAGPYVSTRLTPHLFFDARAAWGSSDNSIDPLGVYIDDVSTTRELVSAKLTGSWTHGRYRLRPMAELLYFHEEQNDYINHINIYIPSQSVSLGRLTFGPEAGYPIVLSNRAVLEPFVGLKGIWDFNRTDDATLAGIIIGNEPFRGRVELGASLQSASGVSVRGTASYDGIGDGDFHAYQGQLSVVIPLY